jgi:hypothetical protein
MFFLLPKVTLVLLGVFGLLVAFRSWRQRHGPPRPPRRRRLPRLPRSRAAAGRTAEPLLPASLLKGADRTWVVFVTGDGSGALVGRLRAAQPDAEVTEVDCEQRPQLAATFLIRRFPTVLVANRYGQVESRLVGTRAIGSALGVRI